VVAEIIFGLLAVFLVVRMPGRPPGRKLGPVLA